MQTEAVVFEKPDTVTVRRIEMPEPAAGEVCLRTERSTISAGTEGWALRDLFTWSKTLFPCVPGYQRVGVIEALGPQVTGWQVGERVMATTGRWDGEVKPFWGAHAARANTAADQLFRLPEGIDPVDASGAVVAQVGYNAASRVFLQPDDWVVVYGDGIIGQCAAQAARARGARVILVGHRQERLDRARQTGLTGTVNSHAGKVAEAVRAQTQGEPVTAVLDSVQTEASQREYVPLLEHGRGQIVYCGFTPGTSWADMALLQQRELTAYFVSGWNRTRMEATLALLASGQMRLRPLVTHHVPYSQAPDMYRMIGEKNAPFLGITLDWTE